jgi:YceI-like domain
LLEYNPAGPKEGWLLTLLAHGTISSIRATTDPFPPKAGEQPPTNSLRYTVAPASRAHISGSSDVYDWTLETTQLVGFLELNRPLFTKPTTESSSSPAEKLTAKAEFFLPLRHFSSGVCTPTFSSRPDQAVFQEALSTTEHPNIVYRLHQLSIRVPRSDKHLVLQSTGELVLGGVTNIVSIPLHASPEADGIKLSGSTSIQLSNYVIHTDSIKTEPCVKIANTAELQFELTLKHER